MELRHYLGILWRWWWLIALSVLIAGGSSFLASRAATPLYRTKTSLIVGRFTQDPDPNAMQLYTSQQLAQTYIQLATREPVLRGAIDSLGLDIPWGALRNQVSASAIPQTQLLEITVVDSDPYRAKVLADAIAQQLILLTPANTDKLEAEQAAFAQQQLVDLKEKIETSNQELDNLRIELDAANSARQIQDLQTRISLLENKVSGWQATYSQLLLTTQGGDINTLTVVEEAAIPRTPFSPNVMMNMLTSAAIGLALALGGIFVIEYLDDTLKTPEDVERQLKLPVIGLIGQMERERNEKGQEQPPGLYVVENPLSPIAEGFRTLRTNLEFASVDKAIKTLLVTSASPSEGKTTMAVNLAAIIAQSEQSVALLDCDLRKPTVHRQLGIANRKGLTDLFRERVDIESVLYCWGEPGFNVVTSGGLPPNPAELLGSQRMEAILDELKKSTDIVIIDSPPCIVADPIVLSTRVDGVLLVVEPGSTKIGAAQVVVEQLQRVGARVVGVVMNPVSHGRGQYYSKYRYYSSYYSRSYGYYYGSNGSGKGKSHRGDGKAPKETTEMKTFSD